MQDYIAPRALSVRTCAASGTKFFDSNANGVRDDGEPGIPRFLIWADYDNDGVFDSNEPFSVSDDQGHYVISTSGIRTGSGRRCWRDEVARAGWRRIGCARPPRPRCQNGRFHCASEPIDPNLTPNATGRDFGNWFPARLDAQEGAQPA